MNYIINIKEIFKIIPLNDDKIESACFNNSDSLEIPHDTDNDYREVIQARHIMWWKKTSQEVLKYI